MSTKVVLILVPPKIFIPPSVQTKEQMKEPRKIGCICSYKFMPFAHWVLHYLCFVSYLQIHSISTNILLFTYEQCKFHFLFVYQFGVFKVLLLTSHNYLSFLIQLGLERCLAAKSISCSCRKAGFCFQYPNGQALPSAIPVPGVSVRTLGLCGLQVCTQ